MADCADVNPADIQSAQEWISTLLDYTFQPDLDFFDALKSGVLLCELLNKVRPGTCSKFTESKYVYIHKRNLETYLAGCRSIGMDKTNCFQTSDILYGRNLDRVLSNLLHLSELSKSLDTFSGPFLEHSSRSLHKLFHRDSMSNAELSQLQTAETLYKLILVLVQHVQIMHFRDASYWKSFAKYLRSHLQLITDFAALEKLLNSAYIVSVDGRKQYCSLLEILGYHLFNNAKIEGEVEYYADIYRHRERQPPPLPRLTSNISIVSLKSVKSNSTDLALLSDQTSLSSVSEEHASQPPLASSPSATHKFRSTEVIWDIINLVLENGANPFMFVEYNSHAKCVKSTQSFESVRYYYNALYIMYRRGKLSEQELTDRFLFVLSFAKTSWKDESKPKPAVLTYCRVKNTYYYFGGAINAESNPLILPKLVMSLLSMGYDMYHECKCSKFRKTHVYSYKFIVEQQEYVQFTSCLNSYTCSAYEQPAYLIDFLYYMKHAHSTHDLQFFDHDKWIYAVLKRIPLLNKEWLLFIGNLVYPKIVEHVQTFLTHLIKQSVVQNIITPMTPRDAYEDDDDDDDDRDEEDEPEYDEYFAIWNAWIDSHYRLNYVARLIPFAGLIYGATMKKLIQHYAYFSSPYLRHILNTNYQFSETWDDALLFELLSDAKIPQENLQFIVQHIHSIYSDCYESEGLYRTVEIYDLVFHSKWDGFGDADSMQMVMENMLLLFKGNKYFAYAINAHFHRLCHPGNEQKLSFFLSNKILSLKLASQIDGLIYHRLTYLIRRFEQMNTYSVGRIFHWMIREYTKCDTVRVKNAVRLQLMALLRNNDILNIAQNNKRIKEHCDNLLKLTA